MYAKLIHLISLVLVLSLMGHVQAQTATWTDADPGDHLWSTPGNWSEFPTLAHWVKVRGGAPGPTIASEGAEASKVSIGYEDESALTVDGGSLTVDDFQVGRNTAHGTLNMIDGTITIGRDLDVGYSGSGTVNMTGGTIIVNRDLTIPDDSAHTAHVNLHGGTIIVNDDFVMREIGGSMDIAAGTLIIDANVVSIVQGYVDNGWITAYDANGTVEFDYDLTNEGQTTVKAVHKLHPYPVDGSTVAAGDVELSWTLPDPCTPGQPVLVDIYFTDDLEALQSFSDPASIRIASQSNVTSVTAQTVVQTRYYWAVDTYIGDPNDPIWGPIFSFVADNIAPEVSAGEDVTTWLDNGSVEVALNGTVIDGHPTSTVWTVVSEPNDPNSPDAVIVDSAALDTTVTLSALGEYVLQLQAGAGEYLGTDTLTINVYTDHCAAAQSQPGWQPVPGDINLDCVVDQADLDILLEHWLDCNGLDCPDGPVVDPNGL